MKHRPPRCCPRPLLPGTGPSQPWRVSITSSRCTVQAGIPDPCQHLETSWGCPLPGRAFPLLVPEPPKELTFGSFPPHPSHAQLPCTARKHLAGLAPKPGKNSMPSCQRAPCHLSRWRPVLAAKRPPNGTAGICKGQDSQLEGSQD